ncbi:ECF RNA polymerase sigma factor SigR [Enhygromyxa salina]|uniref:ECF RNA polymerase sigma factor SigR n=1 Tax=Enhygromyxa salina TaxID=215803 RepID=A0A2S9YCB8_9BACT|nr:sigma-70 family RNA polymerase sigma factor [Enhygromyxa salina]PRQ02745.1 ECF RNA polymerase sigma factor SigR [Enhygromyxa salina]
MELEDLLERWRADPRRHGEEFGSRLYALAYRYIRKRVHDDAARDLAQSAVATALAKHEDFVGGSLQRWINKIASNQVRNHWRRQQRERVLVRTPASELPDSQTSGVSRVNRQRQRSSLRKRIAALTTPYRVVINWHLRGLSPQEIASEISLHPGTVRVRLHRAILQLRSAPIAS